ncbi:LemA family protein [Ideonella azotifigens]|uniref:LemA family protein n=1 Tax=Ideonella azotifigens TaxID=513160 RepID=A0ABP3UTE7_9BURK|nr:LemA family protein [Ideonella azotifigens]MCD2339692.1 LemA family protein [Ideonella azotifigens]
MSLFAPEIWQGALAASDPASEPATSAAWPSWLQLTHVGHVGGWLLELALILVIAFWMVGAYNRLMRLRNALGQAWVQIDELLVRRAAALDMLLAAVREPLADEAGSLQVLMQAQERQRQAALAMRPRPYRALLVAAWVAAERDMASPMARLHALLEQQPTLDEQPGVHASRQQLTELAARLVYARQSFSDAAAAYNQALTEFPTRLLTRLFGFRAAAKL